MDSETQHEAGHEPDPIDNSVSQERPNPFLQTELVSADSLVGDDTDRPVADNTRMPDNVSETTPETPSNSEPISKRGRKPLDEAEKKRRALLRTKAKLEGRPPPDFSDLGGVKKTIIGVAAPITTPARNYVQEAAMVFVPVSAMLGKMLGPHWGIEIDQEKKNIKFTDEQQAYLTALAQWIEYEQFPPASPRIGFIIATLAYSIPKTRIDPTPERLKIAYLKVSGWVKSLFKKKE